MTKFRSIIPPGRGRKSAREVLQSIIEQLNLGYAEGPINTPEGGAIVIVYHLREVDLTAVDIPREWTVTQEAVTSKKLLTLKATPTKRTPADLVKREPIPGDVLVIPKVTWVKYQPDLIRVDPHHWWLRIADYEGKPWAFFRAQRNTAVVVHIAAEDRDIDPILAKHIQWAQEAQSWQEFKEIFGASGGGVAPER